VLAVIVGVILIFVALRPSILSRASVPEASGIKVVAGTYGENCGAPYGNATRDLALKCNGLEECDYQVRWQLIGDPAYGCKKEYVAKWRCGDNEADQEAFAPAEAGFGVLQ
jgi:hypothetical protein